MAPAALRPRVGQGTAARFGKERRRDDPGHILNRCGAGAYMSRYSVVVDDDIDPSNLQEGMWAVATRTDPAVDVDIIQRGVGSKNDPMFVAHRYDAAPSSKAVIDAGAAGPEFDGGQASMSVSPCGLGATSGVDVRTPNQGLHRSRRPQMFVVHR